MLRTLHGYVTRDLLKTLLLALVVLTLVMAMFAIIEPLRKKGLAAGQAIELFALTIPITISLTLPIAALFAATMVYGRLSQDNEILACRASGIGTLTVLRPAVVMGGVVTLVTLAMSNYVSPALAVVTQKQIEGNLKGMVAHEIRTRGYFRHEAYLIAADEARVLPDGSLMLDGMVAIDIQKPGLPRMMAANRTRADFRTIDNQTFVQLTMSDASMLESPHGRIQQMSQGSDEQVPPLPDLARDSPSVYNWNQLLFVRENPSQHAEIRRELRRFARQIQFARVLDTIREAVKDGQEYRDLQKVEVDPDGSETLLTYRLSAGNAELGSDGRLLLQSDGQQRRVHLRVVSNQTTLRQYFANEGQIIAEWSPFTNQSRLTIVLRGKVTVRVGGGQFDHVRDEARIGSIPLPQTDSERVEDLQQILDHPEEFTRDGRILHAVKQLRTTRVPKMKREAEGEIHGRLAYGIACLLMVSFGAALGLIFRGGQIVSAFALSVIPAATVIIVIIMGKQLLSQPPDKVPTVAGVGAIWGGVVALLIANVVVYWRLGRE